MNTAWSSLEQAQRDILLHSAQGDAFRTMSAWYSFVYQYGFEEGSWRRALKELAHGRRGSKRTTFDVVRHVLRQYDEVFRATIDPANPNTLTFVECLTDSTVTAFDFTHVNRFVSTSHGIMWAHGPQLCDGAPQTSATLSLAPEGTFYWQKPSTSWPAEWESGESYEIEVRLLPFTYYEWQPSVVPDGNVPAQYYAGQPCLIEVYVLGHLIPNVPTTYLQPDGVLTAAGVPYGGQLIVDEFTQANPLGQGPHPLYLVSQDVFETVRDQIQASLAAGVTLRMIRAYTSNCAP
jgi:hypothetical protein